MILQCYYFIPIRPHQIYHVTVMPCFDKKLEASRNDFYNDMYKTRDVDCVITSGEKRHATYVYYVLKTERSIR